MKRLFFVVGLALSLLAGGCASLPRQYPLPPEAEARARAAFRQLAAAQMACGRWADAEAFVSLDSMWQSSSLPGYLQLLAPGFLRFVGLNPLGQPLLILTTDGQNFTSILPIEMRAYEGPVTSPSFQRYVPPGLTTEGGYYWLIGRLQPGLAKVLEVAGEDDGPDFWVKISYGDGAGREMVRFDPERLLIRRHQLLDERDQVVLDVSYDEYTASPCALPGLVTIRSGRRKGTLALRLRDWRTADPLSPQDFAVDIPPGFNRIKIP
jgi:hypothetical protein